MTADGDAEELNRWRYSVTDWADNEYYLTKDGDEVSEDEAEEYIATYYDSNIERHRRADLWESKQADLALAAKATMHSRGTVISSTALREDERNGQGS